MDLKSGNYEILEEIGRGGMAVVYRALQKSLDRIVAIKELDLFRISSTPNALQRFQLEAKAAASLDHPNIITIFDFRERDGKAYIAMEFVDGPELKEILARHNVIDPALSVMIAGKVADALRYAHAKGMIHRDVKPGNIMISSRGEVKLADFGLVSMQGDTDLTMTGQIIGTPAYMSPEQIRGDDLTPASDIFSLGTVLYEMVTGAKPFKGTSHVSQIHSVLHEEPSHPANISGHVPEALSQTIMRCLEKEPERRFASMEEVSAALSRSLSRDLIEAADLTTLLGANSQSAQPASETRRTESTPATYDPVPVPTHPETPEAPWPPGTYDATLEITPEEIEIPSDLPPLENIGETDNGSPEEPAEPRAAREMSPGSLSLKDIPAKPERKESPQPRRAKSAPASGKGGKKTGKYLLIGIIVLALAGFLAAKRSEIRKRRALARQETARAAAALNPGFSNPDNSSADEAVHATGPAYVKVEVRPWGRVFLDGKPLGSTRSSRTFTIPSGLHTIVVYNPKGGKRAFILNLKPGEKKKVRADFQKMPE